MATLSEIVEYTNKYLRIRKVEDWPNALNGLQIENSGNVTKIGAAGGVDPKALNRITSPDKDIQFWTNRSKQGWDRHRRGRFGNLSGRARENRHLHYRRSTPLGCGCRGGIGNQSSSGRPLRDRN